MSERSPGRQQYLDTQARSAGFRNFEELRLWQLRREAKGGTAQQSRMPSSVGEAWNNAMAWHPRKIMDYVRQQWSDATGGD